MHSRSFLSDPRTLLLLVALTAPACVKEQYRISVAPSLRPVDSARPMVVFSQIQGRACGRDAVLGAIRDMKRLRDVDGYLEVVVEESGAGDERCAKVTAYPFRYGDSTETPALRAGEESLDPVQVPGRPHHCPMHEHMHGSGSGSGSSSSSGSGVDCDRECGRVAALLEPQPIKQALTKDRCMQRCTDPASGIAACVAAATTAAAASACLTPAAQPGSAQP